MTTDTVRSDPDGPETVGRPPDGGPARTVEERVSVQLDCMGHALVVWELMAWADGRSEVVARRIHRAQSPDTGSKVQA